MPHLKHVSIHRQYTNFIDGIYGSKMCDDAKVSTYACWWIGGCTEEADLLSPLTTHMRLLLKNGHPSRRLGGR